MAVQQKPVVCLATPTYDCTMSVGTAMGTYMHPSFGNVEIQRVWVNSSLLTRGFNNLWCAALNARKFGVTHFAMCHADITPPAGWVDVLVKELIDLKADVVAAVSPIKTEEGLTSTAVGVPVAGEEFPYLARRLTMREVYDLPPSFTSADVGGPILLNTGLWVADLRRPWWDELNPDGKTLAIRFHNQDRIVLDPDGEYHTESLSEDWFFSHELHKRGAKLYATRKVTLVHEGSKGYPTDRAWGTQKTDELYERLFKKRATCESGS